MASTLGRRPTREHRGNRRGVSSDCIEVGIGREQETIVPINPLHDHVHGINR